MNMPALAPRPVVGAKLRPWLGMVLVLFGLLSINSFYLATVTLLESATQRGYQDFFYLGMFLGHLLLGLLLIPVFLVFGVRHLRRAWQRSNRAAVRAGLGLFLTGLVVLLSGLLLTRFGFFEINQPQVRSAGYWVHVISPLVAIWLFVLHRLAGRPIAWGRGLRWAGAASLFAVAATGWQLWQQHQRAPLEAKVFEPSLFSIAGGRIEPERLMTDDFCAECHQEIADTWSKSAHRFSSFNNPAYKFSVAETRRVVLERDGSLDAARFCGGCHDPVPMASGGFDDPHFDMERDPTGQAGLTCVSCHAITRVGSRRGNSDFVLAEPVRYPFEDSHNGLLKAVANQLIKAKPEHHKRGFLKPLHTNAEFCSTCHKVFMTPAVNHYKWLRGQNHYDSWFLSGVSGHRVDSFYYPERPVQKCANCHMPLLPSADPAARDFAGTGELSVHSHLFPAANTGLAQMVGLGDEVIEAHRSMLKDTTRVDIFGIREAGEIDGVLHPIGADSPVLEPGRRYLVEAVVRTQKIGHHLTQGTADSNELWLDVRAELDGRLIGRSGGMAADGTVDPWSFFLNAYVLDRNGDRLDRRNGQDTFVALYNHQIPPGAAAVVHYLIEVPEGASGELRLSATARYRKFDTTYLKYIQEDAFRGNDLPVATLGSDAVTLRVGAGAAVANSKATADWQRWNDYGIGLLLVGSKGTLRQAEEAFQQVVALGQPHGLLNLARVYLAEGRIEDAAAVLTRAAGEFPDHQPWTRAWLTAEVDRENGHFDQAIATLRALLQSEYSEAQQRGFDFSQDYRARATLGRVLYERSRLARGPARADERTRYLQEARDELLQVLQLDAENLSAHNTLALIYADLGDDQQAAMHRARHSEYKPDDLAVAHAVTLHRTRNPAADHAAEPVAIYDLQRQGAYELAPAGPADAGLTETDHARTTEPRG